MSVKLEVITLTNSTIIKYHISENRTAIMTITGNDASFEVKDYGPPTLPLIEVEVLLHAPGQKLRKGQIWQVKLADEEGIISVKIEAVSPALVNLTPTKGRKWMAGFKIIDVDWIERQ